MLKLFKSSRASLGLIGIIVLGCLGYFKGMDVSMAIAGVVASVAAANGYEGSKAKKTEYLNNEQ